ncbi:WYL domain-containing protein [Streptomyces scopuliridis]|uniref:WYL domain-containing protein n=1 Tax=Streptomyces scopuliridis TaxID=452529 RepID=UPI0035D7711E
MRNKATVRDVDPHGLVHTGRRWYFVARDVTRDQWRTFRGPQGRQGRQASANRAPGGTHRPTRPGVVRLPLRRHRAPPRSMRRTASRCPWPKPWG